MVVLLVASPPSPREKAAQRAARGGQAHDRRASFDADDTTACAGPLPTFREMKSTGEVLVDGAGK